MDNGIDASDLKAMQAHSAAVAYLDAYVPEPVLFPDASVF